MSTHCRRSSRFPCRSGWKKLNVRSQRRAATSGSRSRWSPAYVEAVLVEASPTSNCWRVRAWTQTVGRSTTRCHARSTCRDNWRRRSRCSSPRPGSGSGTDDVADDPRRDHEHGRGGRGEDASCALCGLGGDGRRPRQQCGQQDPSRRGWHVATPGITAPRTAARPNTRAREESERRDQRARDHDDEQWLAHHESVGGDRRGRE